MNDIAANHQRAAFRANVADRFGVLPNFFCSASAAPGLIERLWDFAQSAYLDSPLPSLFKERLFVHLSRFCPVRYCIVRHVGFLIGAGRPAGDAAAPAETVAEVLMQAAAQAGHEVTVYCTNQDAMRGWRGNEPDVTVGGVKIVSIGKKKYPDSKAFEMYALEETPKPRQVVQQLPDGSVRVLYV